METFGMGDTESKTNKRKGDWQVGAGPVGCWFPVMILPLWFSIYIIHHLTCRFAVAFYGGSTHPQLVALVAQVRSCFNNLVICFSDMTIYL